VTAELDRQRVARLEELDALEAGGRPGDGEEVEGLVDAPQIGPRADESGGEKGLDLGREQQPVRVGRRLSRPVQRADAEAVTREQELTATLVPEARANWPWRCSSIST
jgi:hypothetical protein